MKQRTEQVASTLKRAVQEVLSRGLSDPRVRGLITIVRVEVTGDLEHVTIFCTVSPSKYEELSMHGLKSAANWIRRQTAEKVRFRRMPHFVFKVDEQYHRQQEVLACIAEAKREDEKRASKRKQKDD